MSIDLRRAELAVQVRCHVENNDLGKNREADKTMRINEGSPAKASTFLLESMTASSGSAGDDSLLNPVSLPPLAAFSIEDCAYRGEGNANVVIALPQEHKVIRFRKSLPEEVSPDGGKVRVEREVEFMRNVVSCFLGSYVQTPEILHYDMKDIIRLSEAIRALRPDKRRHKEIRETFATKLPDYTFLREKLDSDLFRNSATFCVEIKPKQGYLSKSEQRFQKCPYCLTQYYKLKKKAITARSTYCPLDLFSGEEERMKIALKGLLTSPQNNLKIFKNGIVVYDQESSSSDLERVLAEWFRNSTVSTKEGYVDKFCDLVRTALLFPFRQEPLKSYSSLPYNFLTPAQQEPQPKSFINPDVVARAKKILYFAGEDCNGESNDLPNDSVLERILRMQRLPFVSTDYIYHTYSTFSSLLTDEMIYSNLIKSGRSHENRTSPPQHANTLAEDAKSLKNTYLRICDRNTSKRSKFNNDSNGNRHINSESSWSGTNEGIENVPHIPKSTLFPSYLEQNNLHNHKSTIACNEDDGDCNKQKTNCFISIENLLALQNYLLFSSARDCSILLAFRELNLNAASSIPYEHVMKLSDELSFLCNIGVSDLDPKNFHCIEKHRQRDAEVLNSVISVLEEELTLKNQLSVEKRHSQ